MRFPAALTSPSPNPVPSFSLSCFHLPQNVACPFPSPSLCICLHFCAKKSEHRAPSTVHRNREELDWRCIKKEQEEAEDKEKKEDRQAIMSAVE
ncbi:hypothetical protein ACLKA7_004414 [Drosophila subpalustris]